MPGAPEANGPNHSLMVTITPVPHVVHRISIRVSGTGPIEVGIEPGLPEGGPLGLSGFAGASFSGITVT